ncbi:hypothetical protein L484_004128 [Morus notabilis]|uniref:Uncharacterized protein n=1 Tax=Morus notabilis TaxID=981085 RepID=W9RZM4_9ROSA|nr:hypothetical protein L484_004128 [Morus notabilis]
MMNTRRNGFPEWITTISAATSRRTTRSVTLSSPCLQAHRPWSLSFQNHLRNWPRRPPIVDIYTEGPDNAELEKLEFIHIHKIAIVLEASVVLDATLNGGSDEEVEKLQNFKRNLRDSLMVVNNNNRSKNLTEGKNLRGRKLAKIKVQWAFYDKVYSSWQKLVIFP